MYYKTATLGQIINKTMYGWKDVTFITDKVILRRQYLRLLTCYKYIFAPKIVFAVV